MKRAFTLVELLVMLAVVLILAAILFPVFAKARENARRSSCQSNLKQIGLGFMQYARDYDEKFPLAYANSDGLNGFSPNADAGWMQILQPYLKSQSIFQCPTEDLPLAPPLQMTDYWYSAPISQVQNMAKFRNVAQTVLCGDGVGMRAAFVATHGAIAYSGDAPRLKYNGEIWDTTEATNGKGGRRHLGGLNFLFCDGHVKFLQPQAVGAAPIAAGTAPLSSSAPTFRVF